MIETIAQAKRRVRDAKIKTLYEKYHIENGALKSAAIEKISRDLKVSVTTVNRIVKEND